MAVGSKLAGIGTGIAVRKLSEVVLDKVWVRTKGTQPPAHPAAPDTPWAEALIWAVASGAAVGVGRLVAMKGAASAKVKLTGKAPEGMEPPPGRRTSAGSKRVD